MTGEREMEMKVYTFQKSTICSSLYLQDVTEVNSWVEEFVFLCFQYGQGNKQRIVRRQIYSRSRSPDSGTIKNTMFGVYTTTTTTDLPQSED